MKGQGSFRAAGADDLRMIQVFETSALELDSLGYKTGERDRWAEPYFSRLASHMSNTAWLFGSIVMKVTPIPELVRE